MPILADSDAHAFNRRLDGLFRSQAAVPPALNAHQPVMLYGAGQLGRLALEFCRHVGVRVHCVIDRAAKPGQELDGVPVLAPERVVITPRQVLLVATVTSPYEPIARSLRVRGWRHLMPFYDFAETFSHRHPLNNGWFAGKLERNDRQHIRRVLNTLADAHSQAAYLQFLAWRVLRQEWTFTAAPVTAEDKYLIAPIRQVLGKTEKLVDIGAYDGRFLLQMRKELGDDLASAHLFEPDDGNFALLEATLSTLGTAERARVVARKAALSSHSGSSNFQAGFDMASKLGGHGEPVQVLRLDDLSLAPTYVKVHVEGHEIPVLEGGLATLRTSRPIVAVTCYHNRDSLWRLPDLLIQALDEYDIFFRLHTWGGTGAVAYAVPRER